MTLINDWLEKIDTVIANGKYKDTWDSLITYPKPQWFNQARLGIFSHWGVFSVPAYRTEWYPRFMYQKGHPIYNYHKKKYGTDFHYKDFIKDFKGEKFCANDWVDVIKSAQADYYMPVAEHHDGFKMHNSELSKWNSVQMAMHRDIIGELKQACEANNIVFGMSNHRAEHYWFLNGMRTLSDKTRAEAEKHPDFYGPCVNPCKTNFVLNAINFIQEKIDTSEDWRNEWLVHACEQIDLYQPQIFYYDWIVFKKEYRPQMRKFLAYYFNRSLEWGKEVCLAYKRDAVMYGCGVYDRERGQLPFIAKEKWQCDTSTDFTSWSYVQNQNWKSAKNLASTFVDVVSKNGNLLLNICPKGDGSFSEQEKALVKKFGDWNKLHYNQIWHTIPYKVFGEGKAKKQGTMKEGKEFAPTDYRFTYTAGHIYAFNLNPTTNNFCIKTMRSMDSDDFGFNIKDVKIIGHNNSLTYKQKKDGLHITVQGDLDLSMPICFDVNID